MRYVFISILNLTIILSSIAIFIAIEYELGRSIKVASLDKLKNQQMEKCEVNDNLFIQYVDFNCSGGCQKYCEYKFITHSAGVNDDVNLRPIHNLLDKDSMKCATIKISKDNKTETIGNFYDCFTFNNFTENYERYTFIDIMLFIFILSTLIVVINLIIILKFIYV